MKINEKGVEFATLDSALNVAQKLELGGYNANDKLEIERNGFIYLTIRNYKDDYIVFKVKKSKQDLNAYMFYGSGFKKFQLAELDSLMECDTIYAIRTGKIYSKSSFDKIMKLKSVYEMTSNDERKYLSQLNLNILNFYNTLINDSGKHRNYKFHEIKKWCEEDAFFETYFSSETLIHTGFKPIGSGEQYYYFYNVLLDKYPKLSSFSSIINRL